MLDNIPHKGKICLDYLFSLTFERKGKPSERESPVDSLLINTKNKYVNAKP